MKLEEEHVKSPLARVMRMLGRSRQDGGLERCDHGQAQPHLAAAVQGGPEIYGPLRRQEGLARGVPGGRPGQEAAEGSTAAYKVLRLVRRSRMSTVGCSSRPRCPTWSPRPMPRRGSRCVPACPRT